MSSTTTTATTIRIRRPRLVPVQVRADAPHIAALCAQRRLGAAQVARPQRSATESDICARLNAALADMDPPAPRVAWPMLLTVFGSGTLTGVLLGMAVLLGGG